MLANADGSLFCCLENLSASAEDEDFRFAYFELHFVVRALSHSVPYDLFELLRALF
jgi:hypothetical protein